MTETCIACGKPIIGQATGTTSRGFRHFGACPSEPEPAATIIDMTEADLREYAESEKKLHDPMQQAGTVPDRCAYCNYTRHPCATFDLASAVLELLDR